MPKKQDPYEQHAELMQNTFPPKLVTFFQDHKDLETYPDADEKEIEPTYRNAFRNRRIITALFKTDKPEFWLMLIALTAAATVKIVFILNR